MTVHKKTTSFEARMQMHSNVFACVLQKTQINKARCQDEHVQKQERTKTAFFLNASVFFWNAGLFFSNAGLFFLNAGLFFKESGLEMVVYYKDGIKSVLKTTRHF